MPISTPKHSLEVYGHDDEHFKHVYEHLFKPALAALEYEAIPPAASGSDLIHAEIIKNLCECDFVLCDMSTLNANVFFELGIRTALNLPVATVKDSTVDGIPFDQAIINCHTYDHRLDPWVLSEQIPKLSAHIKAAAEGSSESALWKFFGVASEAARPASGAPSDDDKFEFLIRQMEALRSDVRSTQGVDQPQPNMPVLRFVEPLPGNVQKFLHEAWNEAMMLHAVFEASMLVGTHSLVLLDFTGYALDSDEVAAIASSAHVHQIELRVAAENPEVIEEFSRWGVHGPEDGNWTRVAIPGF